MLRTIRRHIPSCRLLSVLVGAVLLCPQSFGAEEGVAPPLDIITLRDGAEVGCTTGVIDAKGRVSFGAPFLVKPAQARLADMLRLQLERSVAEKAGAHLVRLTNGDRFVGDLVEMNEDEVILDSAIFGELKMPRKFVYSVSSRTHNPVLLASDFATGSMDGWQGQSGSWVLTKDGLHGSGGTVRGINSIKRKLKHEGTVTLVIELDGSKPGKGGAKKAKPFSVSVGILRI